MQIDEQQINQAAEILARSGGVVGIPTETVYGLAGNALDPLAVEQIFALKGRPANDPLIVHIAHIDQVLDYATEFPEPLRILAEAFWPGPITLLLPKKEIIPDAVTSGLPRVALRIPAHPVTHALLQKLNFPLAAPSANPFGYISPTTSEHVRKQLGDKLPLILEGGSCDVGLESTIVGYDDGKVTVYRLGGIAREQLHVKVGPVALSAKLTHGIDSELAAVAPGMLKSHYAPRKPLYFGDIEPMFKRFNPDKIGIVSLRKIFKAVPRKNQQILAIEGDMARAARGLFAALRSLDENPKIEVILAQKFPDFGLGCAINDRLKRASVQK